MLDRSQVPAAHALRAQRSGKQKPDPRCRGSGQFDDASDGSA
ncbi:hypothetical protein XHC_1860 [Xanthomonas hortorum pv. carotae str. M081]|nr:hypothetical protein XHC_1860 [Xanthomonas hortorum pv. carotae str. M081]